MKRSMKPRRRDQAGAGSGVQSDWWRYVQSVIARSPAAQNQDRQDASAFENPLLTILSRNIPGFDLTSH